MNFLDSTSGLVFAVSSPGGERTLVAELSQPRRVGESAACWPDALLTRHQLPWKSIQYFALNVSAPGCEFTAAVPPDASGTSAQAQASMARLLRPTLLATVVFDAQVDDANAIEVDALPCLVSRPLTGVLEILADPRAFADAIRSSSPGLLGDDCDLGSAQAFIDQASLTRLACLFSDGVHTPAFETGVLAEVGKVRWDLFRSRARAVLGLDAAGDSARAPTSASSAAELANAPIPDAIDHAGGDFSIPGSPAAEALARMIRAFGPEYPASLRADMNIVLDEINKLKRNPQHHVRTVPPERPKRTRAAKPSAAS